jgi:hypothetical protein
MAIRDERARDVTKPPKRARKKLPPKGTAARLLEVAGAWGDMSREEIEQMKKDIFGSRRSRPCR